VAGNHARFAYDFSPETVVFRVTSAHSSRIQNCFEHDEETRGVTLRKLVSKVKNGDVPAKELIVGGQLAEDPEGVELKKLGATVLAGVSAAAAEVRKRVAGLGAEYKAVAQTAAR